MACVTPAAVRRILYLPARLPTPGRSLFIHPMKCEAMMNKLTLDLNALTVQSFATDDVASPLFGTVHGRQRPGNTGIDDTDCSAVDACPSARGCSEIAECRPTEGTNCPSAALNCPSSRGCTKGQSPECDPSAVDACISERGCTEINCPAPAES
jgi:hypothetical protein